MSSNRRRTPTDPRIHDLLRQCDDWELVEAHDAGGGRGVFSDVWRLTLRGRTAPPTAIAKLPVAGPNGDAARASGAYDREVLAYVQLLAGSPRLPDERSPTFGGRLPLTPRCYATGEQALLLEDVGQHRAVDQLQGLDVGDVARVVSELALLHLAFPSGEATAGLAVRRSAPAGFDETQLRRGLSLLVDRIPASQHRALARLIDHRPELLEAFDALPAVLCHGDPRADNVVFDDTTQRAVLFDWQQLALQVGEADLAWLTATSVESSQRAKADNLVIADYSQAVGQARHLTELRYRLAFLLPGSAVLLLAQREASTARTAAMIQRSIARISAAVVDLDVVGALDEV